MANFHQVRLLQHPEQANNLIKMNLKNVVLYMGANVRPNIGKPKAFLDLGYNVIYLPQDEGFRNPRRYACALKTFASKINPIFIFLINGKFFNANELFLLSHTIKGKVILWYGDQRGRPFTDDIRRAYAVDVFSMSNTGTNPYFEKYGIKPYFMPCEAMSGIFKPRQTNFTNLKNIVFVGNRYNENTMSNNKTKRVALTRIKMVEFLKKIYKSSFDVYGKGWKKNGIVDAREAIDLYDMAKVYDKYKIIIGHNSFSYIDEYVSNRFWNALAMGKLHLTNKSKGLEKLMTNKINGVWYSTKEELCKEIDYYLKHPIERNKIGMNARKLIEKKHTPLHRIKKLLEHAKKTPKNKKTILPKGL